jgi:hypothetical protein
MFARMLLRVGTLYNLVMMPMKKRTVAASCFAAGASWPALKQADVACGDLRMHVFCDATACACSGHCVTIHLWLWCRFGENGGYRRLLGARGV